MEQRFKRCVYFVISNSTSSRGKRSVFEGSPNYSSPPSCRTVRHPEGSEAYSRDPLSRGTHYFPTNVHSGYAAR